jgi:glutaminyl-peptide cyclotransferase
MRISGLCAAAAAAALIMLTGCGSSSEAPPAFDGQRSFDLLKKQCDFGPRYPGVKAHEKTADFIESELKGKAENVIIYPFKRKVGGKSVLFTNIYAIFNPKASHFVLLCAHWDTRPVADMEVDPAKRVKPILGANDGASGVAVLLELARDFAEKKPTVGVVMAFFDGEDDPRSMYVGSDEFAKTWKTAVQPAGKEIKFDYGMLLDMIGDKDLEIRKDWFSMQHAPKVVEKVWTAAEKAGHSDVFLKDGSYEVEDDHVPLFFGGIDCIDIIDFNYAPWHTLDDTVDKCSAKSLQAVGDVVSKVIYDEGVPSK